MTVPASEFLSYLWHYMVARLLYDELIRPLLGGRVSVGPLVALGVIAVCLLGGAARKRG